MDKKEFMLSYILNHLPAPSPMEKRDDQLSAALSEAGKIYESITEYCKAPEPKNPGTKLIHFNERGDHIEGFYQIIDGEIEILEITVNGDTLANPNDYVKLMVYKRIKSL